MHDPEGLYELNPDVADVPEGLPLIAALTGFADAGGAVTQLNDYLANTIESQVVATFDPDILLDYRARRPIMYFDRDHLTDYRPASLTLSLAHDEIGQPFLFLTGFEPDFQWQRFSEAVLGLVSRFRISTTTWVHAIPMPTPHTRPIGVTVSGNRAELIDSMSIWKPTTQVPSNALHLVEYRLQELEHPTTGFVLLIPHYLADTEFPDAAVKALECVSAATGLVFPTDALRDEGRDFLTKIETQIETNAELEKLVGSLEERHDEYMAGNPLRSQLVDLDGELPSADEIAAELENFLATRRNGEIDPPSLG